MGKLYILIACALLLCNASILAQDKHAVKKFPGEINREVEFLCPPNSVFSQGPALAVMPVIQEQEIADDFMVSGPTASIRLWGFSVDWSTFLTCQPAEMTFTIKFYEINLSDPTIPGDEFASYTMTTTVQYIEVVPDWWVFQADLTFPAPVVLTDGWVSILRVQDADPCWAFITGNDVGGNACVNVDGAWVYGSDYWDMDFATDYCLYTPVEDVPLTNWALVLGLLLIVTFAIIRFRRI